MEISVKLNLGGTMFFFGNIILGIAKVLDVVLSIYMWVIIIRALISWVNPDPYNPIVQADQEARAALQSRDRFFAAHSNPYHHVPAVRADQYALSYRSLDGVSNGSHAVTEEAIK
jgi:hypothetical protein